MAHRHSAVVSDDILKQIKKGLRKSGAESNEEVVDSSPNVYDVVLDDEPTKKDKPALMQKPGKTKPQHTPSVYSTVEPVYRSIDTTDEDIWIMKADFLCPEITLKKGTHVICVEKRNHEMWTIEDVKQNKRADIPSKLLVKSLGLEQHQWYHGLIDRAQAEQHLSEIGKHGAFLIRAKEIEGKVSYVLSLQSEEANGVLKREHFEIKNPSKGNEQFFFINRGIEFPSLELLVKHYSDDADGLPTNLKLPHNNNSEYLEAVGIHEQTSQNRPPIIQQNTNDSQTIPMRPQKKSDSTERRSVPQPLQQHKQEKRHVQQPVKKKTEQTITERYLLEKEQINRDGPRLGGGEFGDVYKGRLIPKGEDTDSAAAVTVAIKYFKTEDDSDEDMRVELQKEIKVLQQFKRHAHLVIFYGYSRELNCIVMEYQPKGDLKKYLMTRYGQKQAKKTKAGGVKINLKKFVLMAYQIANGMSYLESIEVVHRDLAARNILLDDTNRIKITDFGLSRKIEQVYLSSGGKVPVKWTAPEGTRKAQFTTKSDVWSYGIVLVEIFSLGCDPYPDMDHDEFTKLLGSKEPIPTHERPDACPLDLYKDIMVKCWRDNPSRRPAFGDVIEPYLKQYVAKLK